jgi:crossover junction endodeoxyribonuclease RusA
VVEQVRRIFLPWPPAPLWPNARPHWAQKAKATKAARFTAKALLIGVAPGPVRITFCPKPLGPKPDRDNCISACKAYQDGIADALGVNDRDLIVTYEMGERCKDGGVIVEIGPQVEERTT